jgi:pyruvate kinase
MLESMVLAPRPTRAEASDVANAILDGADAIMLSEETAIGSYPVQTVSTMAGIASEAAGALPYQHILTQKEQTVVPQPDDALCYAAVNIADQLSAAAILAFTTSGSTAMRVSKYRPRCPVIAVTPSEKVLRKLALFWGLTPHLVRQYHSMDEVFEQGNEIAQRVGVARPGDLIVMTAGLPFGIAGNTNMLRVARIP